MKKLLITLTAIFAVSVFSNTVLLARVDDMATVKETMLPEKRQEMILLTKAMKVVMEAKGEWDKAKAKVATIEDIRKVTKLEKKRNKKFPKPNYWQEYVQASDDEWAVALKEEKLAGAKHQLAVFMYERLNQGNSAGDGNLCKSDKEKSLASAIKKLEKELSVAENKESISKTELVIAKYNFYRERTEKTRNELPAFIRAITEPLCMLVK